MAQTTANPSNSANQQYGPEYLPDAIAAKNAEAADTASDTATDTASDSQALNDGTNLAELPDNAGSANPVVIDTAPLGGTGNNDGAAFRGYADDNFTALSRLGFGLDDNTAAPPVNLDDSTDNNSGFGDAGNRIETFLQFPSTTTQPTPDTGNGGGVTPPDNNAGGGVTPPNPNPDTGGNPSGPGNNPGGGTTVIVPPTPLPLLFTTGDNTIDFNTINGGSYRAGSQYDADSGNDRVTLANSDIVAGRAGFAGNEFFAGNGDDTVIGGDRNDIVYGGNDNDALYGNNGRDTLYGGAGNDQLFGGNDDDRLNGDDGNDTLYGDAGNDVLIGGAGNDTLYAGTGKNVLDGGNGDDVLHSGNYNDFMTGGAGADTFVWHAGDLVRGEQDEVFDFSFKDGDRLDVRELVTNFNGNIEDSVRFVDEASYSMLQVFMDGEWHNVAQLHGVSFREGSVGYDNVIAYDRDTTIIGTPDDDGIKGTERDDVIFGREGNDVIYGLEGNDVLHAGPGKNVLDGGDGDDVLHSGNYNDFMTGGAGADTFVWHAGDLVKGEQDEIFDFSAKEGDRLDIRNLLQGYEDTPIEKLVRFDDQGDQTILQVRQEDGWHNVAQIHGVTFGGGGISYENLIVHADGKI